MEIIKDILSYSFFEISVADVLILIGCMIGALLLDKLTQWFAKRIENRIEKKKKNAAYSSVFLTAVPKPMHLLFMTLGCSFGLF